MAIIKKGKIHGKIGNYIYRVVNGQEIIQSCQRSTKTRGGTLIESENFGKVSQQSSRIYQLVKDFALNEVGRNLYYDMVRFFKKNFYSKIEIINDPSYNDWREVSGFEDMVINSKAQLDDILFDKPKVGLIEDMCIVRLDEFNFSQGSKNIIKTASYIAFGFRLIHYDFNSGLADVVSDFNSERFSISKGFEEQYFEIPLTINEALIERGVLLFAFGLRLFASSQSFGYLNNKEFNPSEILGVWYRR